MNRLPGLLLALVMATGACAGSDGGAGSPDSTPVTAAASPKPIADPCQNQGRTCVNALTTPPPTVIDKARKYSATIRMADGASFTLLLDQASAPVTVNNFVYLAQHKFYDGLTFHRREPGFVLQGGDPLGNGTGGPAYKLPDETNPSPWTAGSLAMAWSKAGISGSQFFILLGDAPHLADPKNGRFNHFGTVVSGMDAVQKVKQGDQMRTIEITVQ